MDVFGDFFGYNPATPEERKAQMDKTLADVQVDHVIKDGRVYINAEEIAGVYASVAGMLAIKALISGDAISAGASEGIKVSASLLTKLTSEILRREADAILKGE